MQRCSNYNEDILGIRCSMFAFKLTKKIQNKPSVMVLKSLAISEHCESLPVLLPT